VSRQKGSVWPGVRSFPAHPDARPARSQILTPGWPRRNPTPSHLTSRSLSRIVLLESILHQGEARGPMPQSPEGNPETQRRLEPEGKTKPKEATKPKDSPSRRDGVTPEHRPRAEDSRNTGDSIRPEDSIREDAELIWSALQGKESAFAKLLQKYRRQVYSLALRMLGQEEDAEDAAQEAFMRAFQSLESCDRDRPFLRWIYRITYNLCVDRYRRKKPFAISLDQTIGEEEAQIELVDGSPSPEELVGRREEQRMLTELLHSLPSRYRVVVVLRHQEDLSYEAIAQILGLPLGTVKARMHRAHNMLRKKLGHRRA
jgi:RNA polymerase sigma-70 factor, ECF subfamily